MLVIRDFNYLQFFNCDSRTLEHVIYVPFDKGNYRHQVDAWRDGKDLVVSTGSIEKGRNYLKEIRVKDLFFVDDEVFEKIRIDD